MILVRINIEASFLEQIKDLLNLLFDQVFNPILGYVLIALILLSPVLIFKTSRFRLSPITITVVFLATILSSLITLRDTPSCSCLSSSDFLDYFNRAWIKVFITF